TTFSSPAPTVIFLLSPCRLPAVSPLSTKQDRDSLADPPARNEDAQNNAQDHDRADQADQGVFKLRAHLEDEAGLRTAFGAAVQREDQRHQNKRHVGERGPQTCAFFGAAQVNEYFRERGLEITHGQACNHDRRPDTREENRNAIHFRYSFLHMRHRYTQSFPKLQNYTLKK